MKEYPILYSTPMVQALLINNKSMTRRVRGLQFINECSDRWEFVGKSPEHDVPHPIDRGRPGNPWFQWGTKYGSDETFIAQCPYGNIGDILWGRETFRNYCVTNPETGVLDTSHVITEYATDKCDPIPMVDGDGFAMYKKDGSEKFIPWKPNIHMPKVACRLYHKITNIRVERIQSISNADSKAEGASEILRMADMKMLTGLGDWKIPSPFQSYQFGFLNLWCSLHGCEGWLANPWVWVIQFKKVKL